MKAIAIFFALIAMVCMSTSADAKSRKQQGIDYAPCKVEVRATGTAWPTESAARGSVQNKWVKEVKARFGEAFGELANARDERTRCYPGVKIGPIETTRCEMIARPCEVRF